MIYAAQIIVLASLMYGEPAALALVMVIAADMTFKRNRERDEDRRLSREYLRKMLDLR